VAKAQTVPLKAKLLVTPHRGVQECLRELGPGLITGAADDDPSGISTYSVAGASDGYAPLWTALLSFPKDVITRTLLSNVVVMLEFNERS
jgi:Mn2+/Fe2+ NRAMP family transporter